MIPQQHGYDVKYPEQTNVFLDMMGLHLDALTIMYRDLLRMYAKATTDEELFNECISEMVVLIDHLHVKLEGNTEKYSDLLKEFEEFEPWTTNIIIPKQDKDEMKKLHRLFKLILKAYDMLGMSNY